MKNLFLLIIGRQVMISREADCNLPPPYTHIHAGTHRGMHTHSTHHLFNHPLIHTF